MVYLFETNIPDNKSILFSLSYIFGLGHSKSLLICKKLGFVKNFKIYSLSKDQQNQLVKIIESLNIKLGSDLKKFNLLKKKKLQNIKSYKGLRRIQGLPVRGQRTHSNAKTSRKIY